MTRRTRTAVIAGLVAGSMALSGCQFQGIGSLPLPGGVSTGPNAYTITAEFADVTNLVPQSAVKVNNVTVGTVTSIELEGWHAKVTCVLEQSVDLPDNAVAKVTQASLLGTKFIKLAPPATAKPRGELSDGDTIPLARTGRYPEVEEVLSALSLLLNGGGLQQIQTITRELNAVLDGREQRIKDLLHELDTFIGGLEEQKSEIVRALEGLERLSATLRKQKQTLADAVDRIEPALDVLNKQQDNLTNMLVALSDLGDVATTVIKQSREDLLANLRKLEPILANLAEAGVALPKALELLLTFPFPGSTKKGIAGDYVNLKVTVDLDLKTLLNNLLGNVPYAKEVPPSARPDGSERKDGGDGGEGGSSSTNQDSGGGSQAPSPPSPSSPGREPGGDGAPTGTPEPPEDDDGERQQDGGLLDLLTGGS